MARWRERSRDGLCIDCGSPWRTVGVGGTTNVCSDCRASYDRKTARRILVGIAFCATGTILQIVVAFMY